ncbi:hypothetical protein U14_04671 [Candidatus Moduliflexus flocculans]|uniref:Uncharacterized protein n=1 Tax=Candidatus Moduliflexus flocculans TaxID=1499966 RepID=A0A0S6W6U0_9BACT|nr:hypothetical protein U14_04671 [Candidatus Moduliflexus flocculans]
MRWQRDNAASEMSRADSITRPKHASALLNNHKKDNSLDIFLAFEKALSERLLVTSNRVEYRIQEARNEGENSRVE